MPCMAGTHALTTYSVIPAGEKPFSSDEESGNNASNPFLDVVAQSSSGILVESFFADEELAKTALSCHLSMDHLCQEMQSASESNNLLCFTLMFSMIP